MARDVILAGEDNPTSGELYFVAYRVDGTGYVNGNDLESFDADDWSDYAVAMTYDSDSGNYYGDFPAVSYGSYILSIYLRAGLTPATTDEVLASDEYEHPDDQTPSETFTDQYQVDSAIFINGNEFAEPIVYTRKDNDNVVLGTLTIFAVIDRHLPEITGEDGKVISDYIECYLRNDSDHGVTTILPRRDTITCSGRFGGTAKPHTVMAVVASDAGVYRVRAR